MKKMKKSLSLMMVVMMMVSMTAMTVFGAADQTITIKPTEGVSLKNDEFTAHLIVDGSWNNEGMMTYDNWVGGKASGSYYATLLSAYNKSDYAAAEGLESYDIDDAVSWLNTIATELEKTSVFEAWEAKANTLGDGETSTSTGDEQTISGLKVGYYIILSEEYPIIGVHTGKDDATNTEVTIKADFPTMVKWIQHNENADVDGFSGGWGIVGDNQVGDTVYFKLKITLPTIFTGYESYVYVLADAMDSSLEFNQNSLEIYMGEDEDSPEADALYEEGVSGLTLSQYVSALYQDDDGFVYGIDVHKMYTEMAAAAQEGETSKYEDYHTMYVYYNATLTEDAIAYEGEQVNSAALVYSKSSKDEPAEGDILEKLDETFDDFDGFGDINDDNFDDSSVKLEEKVKETLDGEDPDADDYPEYGSLGATGNPVYDYTFQVVLNKVDGKGELASGAEFLLFDADGAELNVKAKTGEGIKENTVYVVDTADNGSNIIKMGDGSITIIGLDDDMVYCLQEEIPPSGLVMNGTPFYFMLEAIYETEGDNETQVMETLKIYEVDEDGDKLVNEDDKSEHVNWGGEGDTISSEELVITVINQSGSMLPSTGGMGTVIFQVAGAGMVLAAGALLVMKKKQS